LKGSEKELLLVLNFIAQPMLKSFFITGLLITLATPAIADGHNITITGEIKQGGLVVGKTDVDNTVKLNGKTLAVSATGDYVFGFGRDDSSDYNLVISQANGKEQRRVITPAKRQYQEQSITGIAKSIMQPSAKAIARSNKDSGQIRAARKISSQLSSFSTGFIAPIDGVITGVYGSRRIFNGVKKRPHFGLDYAGKIGDPVKSPAAGKILLYVPDMFYSGGTMIIDHGQGVTSTFLHLSNSYVQVGDQVNQGQIIAAVGNSGRVTGPHLDWRINWFGIKIDPALALKIETIN
jgi:murein DD-endopeptidase MepM/ murein hydrolase activator NlpD